MTKTELDNLLVEAKHISDGALGFEIQQFNRTALPALVAEVERLRRCLDQAIDVGFLQGLLDKENDVAILKSSYQDLYAELKAREEG